jgi:hypothetical protein
MTRHRDEFNSSVLPLYSVHHLINLILNSRTSLINNDSTLAHPSCVLDPLQLRVTSLEYRCSKPVMIAKVRRLRIFGSCENFIYRFIDLQNPSVVDEDELAIDCARLSPDVELRDIRRCVELSCESVSVLDANTVS